MKYFSSARPRNFLLLLFFVGFFFSALSVKAQTWDKPYPGNDPATLYYPDQNAVYLRYGWQNSGTGILIIKGQLPRARYYSYNLYDDRTKGSILALADYEIKEDAPGSGSYTLYIVPEKFKSSYPNQIVIPDSVRYSSIFLRYYLPEGGILAGVPQPMLEWKVGESTGPVSPSLPIPEKDKADAKALEQLIRSDPKRITSKERKQLKSPTATKDEKERIISKVMTMPVFKHIPDPNTLSAYNYNSSGNYPNKDNHYIVMPVNLKKKHALVVRFKAPTFSTQLGDVSREVRYFSLSQGNEYTNTSITMHDAQLKISADGFVYILLGADNAEMRTKATEMGINFMPMLYKNRLVLILRHMLPSASFANSTKAVPLFDGRKTPAGQEAQQTIGGYALVGKWIKLSDVKVLTGPDQLGF
jgi:hypothetical protein